MLFNSDSFEEEKSLEDRVFDYSVKGFAISTFIGALTIISAYDGNPIPDDILKTYFHAIAEFSTLGYLIGGAFPLVEKGFNYLADKINDTFYNNL